jgi:hypothetical protein
VTEREIQETCSAFLELDGWRRVRTDMRQLRGMGVQEKGMADDLFIRYAASEVRYVGNLDLGKGRPSWIGPATVLWIEWKRERGSTSLNPKRALFTKAEKAKIHQRAWHAAERARGALTIILGEDCPASIDGFTAWYAESGLLRNNSLRPRREKAKVAGD